MFVIMHFVGAVAPLASIWALGDVFLGVVILPNLLALLLLSGQVKEMTDSYFQRRPWESNYEVHKQLKSQKKARS
jgi:AGCS family alanine or glycine:cation symporter